VTKVYIVIVNWNGWQDTIECLESLALLNFPSYRIVLCDNGSTNQSLPELRQWAEARRIQYAEYDLAEAAAGGRPASDPALVLIRNGANLGFAGGNNVGLRYALAQGDFSYAWLLNNDTVVDPDALTHLVRRMGQQPAPGICGSTIRFYHDRERVQALGGGHYCRWVGLPWHLGRFGFGGTKPDQGRAERWMNYVEGASMLVSREFLLAVGLLCEDYFLYFEEADWAIRGRGRFALGYAPQSLVYHKVGASIGTSSNPARKSPLCDFYSVRNRLLFTRRFYPAALPSVWLVVFAGLMVRLCLGKWGRAAMISRLLFTGTDGPALLPPERWTQP